MIREKYAELGRRWTSPLIREHFPEQAPANEASEKKHEYALAGLQEIVDKIEAKGGEHSFWDAVQLKAQLVTALRYDPRLSNKLVYNYPVVKCPDDSCGKGPNPPK